MSQPTPVTPVDPADPAAPATASAAPAPKRRRKWLWRLLIAIPVLLVLLLALLPTLLSTGAGRSMLMPMIAKAVVPKGRLQIANWSFGWFSPLRLEGVQISDLQGRHLFQGEVQTQLTLWNAVRSNLAIGKSTFVGDVNDVIDAAGKSKLLDALGVYDWPPAKEPAKMPHLNGTLDAKLTATVELPADASGKKPAPIRLEQGTQFLVDLTHPTTGIGIDGKALLSAGSSPTTIVVKGTADIVDDATRAIAIDPLNGLIQLDAGYDKVDPSLLTSLAVLVAGPGATMDGATSGNIHIDLKPGAPGEVSGRIDIQNITLTVQKETPVVYKVSSAPIVVSGTVTRSGGSSAGKFTLEAADIAGLQFIRGDDGVVLNKSAHGVAEIELGGGSGEGQLRDVTMSRLEFELPDIVTVAMPTPLSVTGIGTEQRSARGKLVVSAQTAGLGKLLAIVGGSNPMPYKGLVTLTQEISSSSKDQITLSGDVLVRLVESLGETRTPIPANLQRMQLRNDVSVDLNQGRATIRQFTLAAADAPDAFTLSLTGTIDELMKQNTLQDVALNIQHDWAQVAELVKSTATTPEAQKSYATLRAAGKGQAKFVLTGSYPMTDAAGAAVEAKQSLRSLKGGGAIHVDQLEYQGAALSNLDLPLTLDDGKLYIAYPDRTGRDRFPPPADINGGKLYLAGVFVDLTSPSMALTLPRDQVLVEKMQLTNVLAANFGRKLNVLFSEVNDARGVVTVRSVRFDAVPVADLASGTGEQVGVLQIDVQDLFLDGQIPRQLGMLLDTGQNGIQGNIDGATVELKNGTSVSDITVSIARTERRRGADGQTQESTEQLPLRFTSTIDFATGKLTTGAVEIPVRLIKSQQIQQLLGADTKTVLPIRGTPAGGVTIPVDEFLKQNIQKGLFNPQTIGNLLGGSKERAR